MQEIKEMGEEDSNVQSNSGRFTLRQMVPNPDFSLFQCKFRAVLLNPRLNTDESGAGLAHFSAF